VAVRLPPLPFPPAQTRWHGVSAPLPPDCIVFPLSKSSEEAEAPPLFELSLERRSSRVLFLLVREVPFLQTLSAPGVRNFFRVLTCDLSRSVLPAAPKSDFRLQGPFLFLFGHFFVLFLAAGGFWSPRPLLFHASSGGWRVNDLHEAGNHSLELLSPLVPLPFPTRFFRTDLFALSPP